MNPPERIWRCPVPTPGLAVVENGSLMILAMTVLGEAEGESDCGKLAVAWVARNRVTDSRWPDTTGAVCLQPWQFSCWNEGSPRNRVMRMPKAHVKEKIWDACFEAAIGAEFQIDKDPTGGANHYCTTNVDPSWADSDAITLRLGNHVFFKL